MMRNSYTATATAATVGADLEPAVTSRNLLLGHLRAAWWSHWREGVRLPAELGVILLKGGKP